MPVNMLKAVCVVSAMAAITHCTRVVFFPIPFTSHTKYQTHVARELMKLGHEAWITMPDYLEAKGVLDTANLTIIRYSVGENMEETVMQGFRDRYFRGEKDDVQVYFDLIKRYCHLMLTNDSLLEEVREIRPKLIVIANIPHLYVLAIIAYRLGVPFAFVGTTYSPLHQRVPPGIPFTPTYLFPTSQRLTFFQRLYLVWRQLTHALLFDPFDDGRVIDLYAPEMPRITESELLSRAEVWLVEADHILDYPKPSLPNVKLIGGTATGPAKPLPHDLQSFMDDAADEGVVVVSFGSYVLDLPEDVSRKVFGALLELPMKSVVRSNRPSPDKTRIWTMTWLPQNDLLAHASTRVFLSHCGNSGQYEALYHGVPVVATPLFGDQFYNAERMRVKGFSETIDLQSASQSQLASAILKVATDPSYKGAISKASKLFKIEFGVPVEKAAFWLDHVIKYGGDHMRSPGQSVPLYQFLGLDIYGFLFSVLYLVTVGVPVFLYLAVRFWTRKQKME